MVPLAYHYRNSATIILVDMPGHGTSDTPSWKNVKAFQDWYIQLLEALRQSGTPVTKVVAHSFGCAVAEVTPPSVPCILLNPVPYSRLSHAKYTNVIAQNATALSFIYNWYPIALLRGLSIRKNYTKTSLANIRWVTRRTYAKRKQFSFQSQLPLMAMKHRPSGMSGLHISVVVGLHDTIPRELDSRQLQQLYPHADILFLNGGHILPIENPQYVAESLEVTPA